MKDFKEIKKITVEDAKEAIECLQQLYMAVVTGRDDSLSAACIRTQNIIKKIDDYQEAQMKYDHDKVRASNRLRARMNLKKAIEEAIDSGLRYVDLLEECNKAYGMKSTD